MCFLFEIYLLVTPSPPFRELYELGVKAFVSFVRFYHKHEYKLIFVPKGSGICSIKMYMYGEWESGVMQVSCIEYMNMHLHHHTALISSDLDLISLAKGFALLHLPKMPELRGRDTSLFQSHPIPPSSIPYRDKTRERQRQDKMTRERSEYY